METRLTISENHFELAPVLEAAKSHNAEMMRSFFSQGYQFSWQDHQTHKTLLEVLGEQYDLLSIEFLQAYFEPIIDDAIKGAAFANRSLQEIKRLAPLRLNYAYALYGAAKGGHVDLIDELKSDATRDSDYITPASNMHFVALGAAEGNHQHILSSVNTSFFRRYNNHIPEYRLLGAARGGHIHEVETLLQKNELCSSDEYNVTDSGASIAYLTALRAAAETGNAGLIAKIFLHLDQYSHPLEHPIDLIEDIISTAAFNGHDRLVFDLLGRLKLYLANQETQHYRDRALTSALKGAINGSRFNLVTQLFKAGVNATIAHEAIAQSGHEYDKIRRLFATLNDPKLCYEIAYVNDTNLYNSGPQPLMPIVAQMFHMTALSDAAVKLYYGFAADISDAAKVFSENVSAFIADKNIAYSDICALILHQRELDAYLPSPQESPPDVVARTSDIIKKILLKEIQSFIDANPASHNDKAIALHGAIQELTCIESMYLLIKEQIDLYNAPPVYDAGKKPKSVFGELALRPVKSGYSYLPSLFKSKSPEFIHTLRKCTDIIRDNDALPFIKEMLDNRAIYSQPEFPRYTK